MPRTAEMVFNDISQVLSPPRSDSGIATSLVFARVTDFIEYMKSDSHGLLFSRNIRLDLLRTEVNKEITRTFESRPEEFAFSNNGITMLCEKHIHETGSARLRIENPRVVNGSQTLHSVRRATKKPTSARVMVKIIEIPRPNPKNFAKDVAARKDIINKIALRTNRQNFIRKFDLAANDEKQQDIARYFRKHKLYYERRQKEWETRKIDLQSVGVVRGPSLKKLMQLGAAYLWKSIGPAKARSSVNGLFDVENYGALTDISPEVFYRMYLLQDTLLESAKRVAHRSSRRNREMRKYVNFVMFSLVIRELQRLGRGLEKEVDCPYLRDDHDKEWDNLIKGLYVHIYQHLTALKKKQTDKSNLTIINYSKNATYMSDLLKLKLNDRLTRTLKSITG
jgi:hypothetical protein